MESFDNNINDLEKSQSTSFNWGDASNESQITEQGDEPTSHDVRFNFW